MKKLLLFLKSLWKESRQSPSENDPFKIAEKEYDVTISDAPKIHHVVVVGFTVIIVFIGGFFLWSLLARIDSAAIAPGKIVVAGSRRVIQHLEGGIVRGIFVKNGAHVKKGQLLLKIDDTQSSSKFAAERGRLLRLLINERRLTALIDDDKTLIMKDIISNPDELKSLQKFIANQKASFNVEKSAALAHQKILEQRMQQLHEQISGVSSQLKSTQKQLKIIEKELSALYILEKKQLVDRSRVLSQQREEQRLVGLEGEYKAKIAELKQKIGETQLSIIAEKDKLHKRWNEELRTIREKLALARESEKAASDVNRRTRILAPVSGIVLNLNVHTLGGVVKPGETLLEVVPQHEALVIDARVNPLDIDVVKKGLIAKVNLSALKTRTIPMLLGKVTYVGADAKVDQRTQESYYEARVKINEKELKKVKKDVLYPGMPVEVMIITNQLTPWEYFTDPIHRSFNRAFRED